MFLRLLRLILMAACISPCPSVWGMEAPGQAQAGDDLRMFGTNISMIPHNYSVPYNALRAYSKTFRDRSNVGGVIKHLATSPWASLLPSFLKQNPWEVHPCAKIDLFMKLERQPVPNTKALYHLAKHVPEIKRYYFDCIYKGSDEKHRRENRMAQDADGHTLMEHAIMADDAQFVTSGKKIVTAASATEPGAEKKIHEFFIDRSLKHNAVRTLCAMGTFDHTKADTVALTEYMERKPNLTLPEVTTYFNALKMKKKHQEALAQAHQKILAQGTLAGKPLGVDIQHAVKGYLQSPDPLNPHRMSTKLQSAIEKGDLETVKICIAQGHSLAACTVDYMDALQLATYHDQADIFRELIQHLPYINERKQRVLLTYAQNEPMKQLIQKELLEYIAQRNAELVAASHIIPRPGDILSALRKGANPNIPDAHGWRRLFETTITWRAPAAVKMLLEYGADKNAQDNHGDTPMHHAVMHDQPESLRLLLEHGADKNAKNSAGETPMHHAAVLSRPECLRLLLEYGADKNAKDNNGFTPTYNAASSNKPETLKLLLVHGADHSIKNNFGFTPRDRALLHDKPECFKVLQEFGVQASSREKIGHFAEALAVSGAFLVSASVIELWTRAALRRAQGR